MKKILKTQGYMLLRAYDLIALGIFLLLLYVWELYDSISGGYIENWPDIYGMSNCYPLYIFGAIIAVAIGQDYRDKTLNYDILYGYSRTQVFLGRFFAGLLVGCAAFLLMILPPVLIFYATDGPAEQIPFSIMWLRLLGTMLVLIRIAAELSLLTVVVKRPYPSAFLAFIFSQLASMYITYTATQMTFLRWLCSENAVDEWFSFEGYETFGQNGGTEVVIEKLPSVSFMTGSVVASIVATGVCLILACRIFRKQDIN
jgi:ABC-type transport system involved in multi-copper enzyme maturation permease subunit